MKRAPFLLFILAVTISLSAQNFDDYFDGRNLRLDYIFAGDNQSQNIYLQQAYITPQWAGRRAQLAEMPLRGNGQITLRAHGTDSVLYVHTFSTLFQEWQATDEAKHVSRAFETSYNIPMPRRKVDISVTLTDFHNHVTGKYTHTLDPSDILIRPIGENGIPHRYIWKGKGDGEADIKGCVDLAIVAEGYTASQMDKFYADCQRAVDALFAHAPFTELKDRFNVVAVAAPSLDSGASVPHAGQWSRTPTATHYDTFYTQRYLMSQDMHRIYDILSCVPFEHILILVNSNIYGGGGIYNQLNVSTSDHPTFTQVLVHEFGHGYAGLGDEYFTDDGYEIMYPSDTEPWEPNLTTLVDFQSKWADLVPEGTLVPTPPVALPDYRHLHNDQERRQLNEATQRVGVFEGGGYQKHGVYRPVQECRMKINEVEHFCPVCSRAIRRITDFYTSQ